MCERSIHLRKQAAKCEARACALSDVRTQDELRKLAAEYLLRAQALENLERPPSTLATSDDRGDGLGRT